MRRVCQVRSRSRSEFCIARLEIGKDDVMTDGALVGNHEAWEERYMFCMEVSV
jgi:hypothetical protein